MREQRLDLAAQDLVVAARLGQKAYTLRDRALERRLADSLEIPPAITRHTALVYSPCPRSLGGVAWISLVLRQACPVSRSVPPCVARPDSRRLPRRARRCRR